MKYIVTLAAFSLLLISGCGSVNLSDKGRAVQVRKTLADHERVEYEAWKVVRCEIGANGRTVETNMKSCENSLRNQAAELGATLITTESKDDRSPFKWGAKCNNCVNEIAHVYRKKAVKDTEISRKEEEPPIKNKIDIPDMEEEQSTATPARGTVPGTAPSLPVGSGMPSAPRAPASSSPGKPQAPKNMKPNQPQGPQNGKPQQANPGQGKKPLDLD